ncbi:MAG: MarR family winged helix-turn-helix transcriptional regulator [Pseudomonadota bacterium]
MDAPDLRDEAPRRFIDDYLSYLLSRASHLVSRQFHAQLKPRGMPVPVWRVLSTLSDGDGLPVTELAKITLFKQPTLTKVIDRMSKEELVERRASEREPAQGAGVHHAQGPHPGRRATGPRQAARARHSGGP